MANKENIIYPVGPLVEVGTDVDWVYIMRKDGNFSMRSVAEKLEYDYRLNPIRVKSTLLRSYDTFCNGLFDLLLDVYSTKGRAQLHLYEAEELEEKTRKIVEGAPAVSLDPLLDINSFKVSRGFYLGGIVDHGQVNRPGTVELGIQAQALLKLLGKVSLQIIEDDVFSGGSLLAALDHLMQVGFGIKTVVPGIRVGQPAKVEAMGVVVSPVISYESASGNDIFDKVDLGDPRDFLIGASGLVVKLESDKYGRLPYILPFSSTTARAQVPKSLEKDFALAVLQLSRDFYASAQARLRVPILLRHTDEHFVNAIVELFNIHPATPMVEVVSWAHDNLDDIWALIKHKGEGQQK